jgi:hypothetical protein
VNITDVDLKALTKQARKNGQHPRTLAVAAASAKIGMAVAQIEEQYKLTHYEMVKCVSDYLSLSMKYALRVERHGDSEYPGDAPPAKRSRKAASA